MTKRKKHTTVTAKATPPFVEVKHIRIDIAGVASDADAYEATRRVFNAATIGAFSDADRNYYVLLIEMNRREVKLAARLEAIEDRLAALENRGRKTRVPKERGPVARPH
jgi:hypothetical protein